MRQKLPNALQHLLVAEEFFARDFFAVAADLAEEGLQLSLELAQVIAHHPVAQILEVVGVEPLLELPRDGQGEHRFAQIQRLADQRVAAVGQHPGRPADFLDEPRIRTRKKAEVAILAFALIGKDFEAEREPLEQFREPRERGAGLIHHHVLIVPRRQAQHFVSQDGGKKLDVRAGGQGRIKERRGQPGFLAIIRVPHHRARGQRGNPLLRRQGRSGEGNDPLMIQADAAQPGQPGGAGQERLKVRDGQLRLPGFDEFPDLPDDGSALPEQGEIGAKAGGQFHAVVTIHKHEAGDPAHVRQPLVQHLVRLVAGQHLDFVAQPLERGGDSVNAGRVSLAFAAAAIKYARHVWYRAIVDRSPRRCK